MIMIIIKNDPPDTDVPTGRLYLFDEHPDLDTDRIPCLGCDVPHKPTSLNEDGYCVSCMEELSNGF